MKLLATLCVLATACYGSAHGPSKRPAQPTLVPDGLASMGSETSAEFLSADRERLVRSTSLSFSYNGEPKTYTEYRAIVDPNWNATLDRHEELVKRCKRARIPKYIGIPLIVVGMLGGQAIGKAMFGENENAQGATVGVIAGTGALTWFSGYLFFGGRACNEAEAMWSGRDPWLEYAESTPPDFADTSKELRKLTNDFNAKVRARKPVAADPPTAEQDQP
jgi:hypothetical protein